MDREALKKALAAVAGAGATTALMLGLWSLDPVKRWVIGLFEISYAAEGNPGAMSPVFNRLDRDRPRIDVRLDEVAKGLSAPVDIQFFPGAPTIAWVLEKEGTLKWIDVGTGQSGKLLEVDVLSRSELGLLGLAFHPKFAENGRFYLNQTVEGPQAARSQIVERQLQPPDQPKKGKIGPERVVLHVDQPFRNHDAGQLAFGPDGYLYIGWGDGGAANDPRGHGQNTHTWLGAMLRIDPVGEPYTVPPDNPFVGNADFLPEIWAYGLRNPWRYVFDPKGRLVVADVGQDLYEEVTIVGAGENHGWKIREGSHCFADPNCPDDDTVKPVYEYGRQDGRSITGGEVYTGANASLAGKYLFADFVTGRMWAMTLPDDKTKPVTAVHTLGKWPILPSAFGRDAAGDVYVLDYGEGRVFRIVPTG